MERVRQGVRTYRVLFWKHWLLECRNKKSTIWTFLSPIILVGILVLFRVFMSRVQVDDQTYHPLGLSAKP